MGIEFFTIVSNGMPFIQRQLPIFEQLNFPWRWSIREGPARHVKDSFRKGGKLMSARLDGSSVDGTSEYLTSISGHPKVNIIRKPEWDGKTEMCNSVLDGIKESCLLWQIDADEVWRPEQIKKMRQMFMADTKRTSAWFWCRCFMGYNLALEGINGAGNRTEYEWKRVWRFNPGDVFASHEPPCLRRGKVDLGDACRFTHEETRDAGLVFDHHAYVEEQQVLNKELYYGMPGLTDIWRKMQDTPAPFNISDHMQYRLWDTGDAVVTPVRDIVLLVPWYVDKNHKRQVELELALKKNLSNPYISRVVLFHEKQDTVPEGAGSWITKTRTQYKDCYDYANRYCIGQTVIVANADIYFDETLKALAGVDMKEQALCLTRHELLQGGKLARTANDGGYCQDAWIFKAPIDAWGEYQFGRIGCDNRTAYELGRTRKLSNPCYTVRAIHVHHSEIRNYVMGTREAIPRPWAPVFCTRDWPWSKNDEQLLSRPDNPVERVSKVL